MMHRSFLSSPSPIYTSKNFFKSTLGAILTENKLEIAGEIHLLQRLQRKIHPRLRRHREEVIRSGLTTTGEDLEEEGISPAWRSLLGSEGFK